MITVLISIITTGLFLLCVLALLVAVTFRLFKALQESENEPRTSQHLSTASSVNPIGLKTRNSAFSLLVEQDAAK
jgi:hypothetical protein